MNFPVSLICSRLSHFYNALCKSQYRVPCRGIWLGPFASYKLCFSYLLFQTPNHRRKIPPEKKLAHLVTWEIFLKRKQTHLLNVSFYGVSIYQTKSLPGLSYFWYLAPLTRLHWVCIYAHVRSHTHTHLHSCLSHYHELLLPLTTKTRTRHIDH